MNSLNQLLANSADIFSLFLYVDELFVEVRLSAADKKTHKAEATRTGAYRKSVEIWLSSSRFNEDFFRIQPTKTTQKPKKAFVETPLRRLLPEKVWKSLQPARPLKAEQKAPGRTSEATPTNLDYQKVLQQLLTPDGLRGNVENQAIVKAWESSNSSGSELNYTKAFSKLLSSSTVSLYSGLELKQPANQEDLQFLQPSVSSPSPPVIRESPSERFHFLMIALMIYVITSDFR